MISKKLIFGLAAGGSMLAAIAGYTVNASIHQQELKSADAVITTGQKDGKTTAFLLNEKDPRGDFMEYEATPVELSASELASVADKAMNVDALNGKLQNALKNSVSAAQDAIDVLTKFGPSDKVTQFFNQVNGAAPEAKDSKLLVDALYSAEDVLGFNITPRTYQEREQVDATYRKVGAAVEELRDQAGMMNALPANLKPPGFRTY